MTEEIKIDGIPIQDYGTLNSRSCYPEEINVGETIKNNIDYWKNLYFKEKEKNKEFEKKQNRLAFKTNQYMNDVLNDNIISKDKIRDMQRYREFELQQEYKEFENDSEWKTYNKILEEN